ncbi:hypothetical protein EV421DRAFT_1769719 [Armillaria borealis]|uniref:DUF6534 domain-containing protein n=1 Tax=Armillaria borealis TaxID=47425 RepID=A0AA39K3M6_9AGAR|nr:hypothetical protein EV421DRAFT_1769719 [Armillaria borealis]
MHLKYFVLFNRASMASLIRACLILDVVTDLLVAVTLCYILHSSRTGMKRTDTLINSLIVYAVHTVSQNIAYPKNLVYLSVYQIVANLYSNSFLATLNARRHIKPVNDNFSTTGNVNTFSFATFGAHSQSLADTAGAGNTNKRHIDVNVTSTVDIMGDTDRNSSVSTCIMTLRIYTCSFNTQTDPGSKVVNF